MKSKTPLKALMLTSSYPRNDTDNSSIFLRYLAAGLASLGVDVHVLAPAHRLVRNKTLDSNIKIHWFQYLPKPWQRLTYSSGVLPNLKRNKLLYLQVPFFLLAMFTSLFFLCRKIKPDVIHAHWIIPQGFIAVIVGKLLNIPVIATAHGGDAFSLNTNILSRLKKLTLKHCHAWTSNTKATAETFDSSNNIPRPTIIPMGVDIKHFQSGNAAKISAKENRNIILFVGRLVEKKGVKYLIKAFSMLPKNTQDNSALWIIGDGDERVPLEKLAKQLGVQNIKFWGHIQNKHLPNFYAASTMFVAPSIIDSKGDTEGQGVILLEAMASKTPIIATTVGGIPEVITHKETGILVPPNNSYELSAAIEYVFNNNHATNEYIESAFIKVNETYSWEAISQKFILMFKNTINTRTTISLKDKQIKSTHRDGFSTTTNREKKATKILTILAKELGTLIENKLILDIGTGSGDIASYLGKKNHVVSVDISDSRQGKDNFNFSICSESLPLKSKTFDIVISNHVIEHVQNQQLHVDEIKRVLKKNGVLYIATPNRLWPFEVHYRLYFLHYLPQNLFINALKLLNQYEEDVDLLGLRKIHYLLNKENLKSYSGKVINNPNKYLMNTPLWINNTLNKIPLKLLDTLTFIHPTFIFIYKKKREK